MYVPNPQNSISDEEQVGILYGTSSDVSDIISLLPMFLSVQFKNIVCVGVSLGGHSTYITLSNGTSLLLIDVS